MTTSLDGAVAQLEWCEAISRVTGSDDWVELLGDQCGPLTGGCLLLALALQPFFQDSVLYGFWRKSSQRIEHVVLMLPNGSTVDGHGWLDTGQLWQIWLRLYRPDEPEGSYLEPVTLKDCLEMQCGEYKAFGGANCVVKLRKLFQVALTEVCH